MNDTSNISVMILAGGQGSRFWPRSRAKHPKQFLKHGSSGRSLIQGTVDRLEKFVSRENISVITAASQAALVEEHVPGVTILAEPFGRNTAAAVCLGAFWLQAQGFDGAMILLPADHAVEDEDRFIETLQIAAKRAIESEDLVTIGIPPQKPETGYGYIEKGSALSDSVSAVKQFCEKPDIERATQYVESGNFYWNSGMFIWRPSVFIEQVKMHLPKMHSAFSGFAFSDFSLQKRKVPTPAALDSLYKSVQATSVDFGIMEHAERVSVVSALSFGWSDVGSWDAWADHMQQDDGGNVLDGDVISLKGSGNIVSSADKFIALLGVEDLVVIDSPDALLVCPKERVQEVKEVVEYLKGAEREDLL